MLTELGKEELEQYQDIYGKTEGRRVFNVMLDKMPKNKRRKYERYS